MDSFFDRLNSYELVYDFQIINHIPIIIRVNGRNFQRLTKRLIRPYCPNMLNIMGNTMLHSITEIEGAVIGFQYSDEIIFILRNDRSFEDVAWYQNKIQKLTSIVSSIISINFYKNFLAEDSLDLDGDPVFEVFVFGLPSLNEALNYLVLKQKICMTDAIFRAAQAELINQYGKDKAIKLLHGKKTEEKLELLNSECDINYNEYYPPSFRKGVASYKIPKIIRTKTRDISKNKWILDFDIPDFVLDRNFLSNIIHSGHDVFRIDRDLIVQE
jgi:tRNA(His) guanylyltransferase